MSKRGFYLDLLAGAAILGALICALVAAAGCHVHLHLAPSNFYEGQQQPDKTDETLVEIP